MKRARLMLIVGVSLCLSDRVSAMGLTHVLQQEIAIARAKNLLEFGKIHFRGKEYDKVKEY